MEEMGVACALVPLFTVRYRAVFDNGLIEHEIGSYIDYLSMICGFERFRAGQFGLRHYCTVGLNPKEANNEELAEAVMEILPRYALKEGVVAIGELGYDEQSALEDKYYRLQLELAKELSLPVMVHTPHRDKRQGTLRSMAVALEHKLDPTYVVIDHNNEETVLPPILGCRRRQPWQARARAQAAPLPPARGRRREPKPPPAARPGCPLRERGQDRRGLSCLHVAPHSARAQG